MDAPASTLLTLFRASLVERREKVGLIWQDQPCTFGELERRSDALAAGLGVAKGDRCGLFAGNSLELILTYLAQLKLGAITVPMNVLYRAGEITHKINDAGVRLVTTDSERLPVLEACRRTWRLSRTSWFSTKTRGPRICLTLLRLRWS